MRATHSQEGPGLAGRRLARLGAVIALAGILALAGCSHRAPTTAPEAASPSAIAGTPAPSAAQVDASTAASTATAPLAPTSLSIPAIGVSTTLVRLGLAKDGTLEVPTQAMTAGWYTGSPAPGLVGPSIIAGHVHWSGIPAVFAHLADLRQGDRVVITRSDATAVVFVVDRVVTYPKTEFPTELVYGNIPYPGLRLITCGGYDPVAKAYEANVVVFATLVTT